MQSDDPEITADPSLQAEQGSESAEPAKTPLRREAVFRTRERNLSAVVAACCSLAGVGVGFGLSQMASSHSATCAHYTRVSAAVPAPRPAPRPARTVTWLGAEVQSSRNALPGAHVAEIVPGSPAERAGLDVGDVIVGFEGRPIASSQELVRAVRTQAPGSQVALSIVNLQGEKHQHRVELEGIAPQELRALGR